MNKTIQCLIVTYGVLLVGCGNDPDLPRSVQTVAGVAIYLGVVPAELVLGHSTVRGDPKALHGGTPRHRGSHHVVVALFDAATGARITEARIRAGVGARTPNHQPAKAMEPMEINGMMRYGNFFTMRGAGAWSIHLVILLVGASQPIEATFGYEHAPER